MICKAITYPTVLLYGYWAMGKECTLCNRALRTIDAPSIICKKVKWCHKAIDICSAIAPCKLIAPNLFTFLTVRKWHQTNNIAPKETPVPPSEQI